MRIGYRVVSPEQVGRWEGGLVQISIYRGQGDSLRLIDDCARACALKGLSYVLHPVGYSLLDPACLVELRFMAVWAGEALILHDERSPDGERLTGQYGKLYKGALAELRAIAGISLENSAYNPDIRWFWDVYASSVTLDIGHLEAAGMDSVEFVKGLDDGVLKRLEYVHIHRNGRLRGGITDHWPLLPGCRELEALRELLLKKSGVTVILELNEIDEVEGSIVLLKGLMEELNLQYPSERSLKGMT